MWGKEGYKNLQVADDRKREYAKDLQQQVEELRLRKMNSQSPNTRGNQKFEAKYRIGEVSDNQPRKVNSSKAAFLAMRHPELEGKTQGAREQTRGRPRVNGNIPFGVPAGVRNQNNGPTSRVIPQVDSRPSSVTEKPNKRVFSRSPEKNISNKPIQNYRVAPETKNRRKSEYRRNSPVRYRSKSPKHGEGLRAYDDRQEDLYEGGEGDNVHFIEEHSKDLNFVQRMLVEERAERKKLAEQLERVTALAERNEHAVRDRTDYLEKLRMKDAVDLREAKDRLRQVETEILHSRLGGNGVETGSALKRDIPGNAGGNQQVALGGILPRDRVKLGARQDGKVIAPEAAQSMPTVLQNSADPARLIAELRARDDRDRKKFIEDEKKRTEMWDEMLKIKRHLDEHRTQISEYALRSADRVASLETRVNVRESSVVRLEEKDSAQVQTLAARDTQIESRYEALVSHVKRLEHQILKERMARRDTQNEAQYRENEIRAIVEEKEKIIFQRISEKMMEVWRSHTEQRKDEQQMTQFNEERQINDRRSVKSNMDRLRGLLEDERNDRRSFEAELNRRFEMRVAAIEANNEQQRVDTELYEKGMQRDASSAMTKLSTMVKAYHEESEQTKKHWEQTYKSGLKSVHTGLDQLRKESMENVDKLENVLRAEIRMREKKVQDSNERAIARETVIDDRAKAVEARILASVKGYDERIRHVEDRVDAALASFKAQMEADLKLNADMTKQALANMDASLQTLSVRVDSNDAESRAAISDIEQVVLEVRALTVSRGELKSTEQRITIFAEGEHDDIRTRLNNLETFARQGLSEEQRARQTGDAKIESDMASLNRVLRKNTTDEVARLNKRTEGLVDKERIARIQGDASVVSSTGTHRKTLQMNVMESIAFAKVESIAAAEEMTTKERLERESALSSFSKSCEEERKKTLISANDFTVASIEEFKNYAVPLVQESTKKSETSEAASLDAQKKITQVLEVTEKHIMNSNVTMASNFRQEKKKRSDDFDYLTNEVSKRLKSMESGIRRVFEQQLASVKALAQANLAAEAAVRLKQGSRLRGEVDDRLKAQKEWVVSKTDYQIGQFNRKVTRMIMDEAQARQSTAMQIREQFANDLDEANTISETRNALDSIIGRLVDKHQDEDLRDFSSLLLENTKEVELQLNGKIDTEINKAGAELKSGIDNLRQEMSDDIIARVEELQENAQTFADRTEGHIQVAVAHMEEINAKAIELEGKLAEEGQLRSDGDKANLEAIESNKEEILETVKENKEKANDKLAMLLEAQDKLADAAQSRGDKLDAIEEAVTSHADRISTLEDWRQESDAAGAAAAAAEEERLRKVEEEKAAKEAADREAQEAADREAKEAAEREAKEAAEKERQAKEDKNAAEVEAPTEPEWEELLDEDQGIKYWKNKTTQEVTYEQPPGL
jgi:hypothetical protein